MKCVITVLLCFYFVFMPLALPVKADEPFEYIGSNVQTDEDFQDDLAADDLPTDELHGDEPPIDATQSDEDLSPIQPIDELPDDDSNITGDSSGGALPDNELLASIDYSLRLISTILILFMAVYAIQKLVIRPLRYFTDF